MVINVYQGFEDVKLDRSAKFRKSPLKAAILTTGQYCRLRKKLSTINQGGAVATTLSPDKTWHDTIRSSKPEGEQ